MLTIVTSDKKSFDYQRTIFLNSTEYIENEFVFVLDWHKDAFWDKKSQKLMKEIDAAERKGDYGVVTEIGESCITFLSTDCKFGLLALYYMSNPHVKLLIDFYAVDKRVWQWLASNVDLQVHIFKENMSYHMVGIENLEVLDDGKRYTGNDSREFFEMVDRCEDSPYIVTKELENEAYRWHKRKMENIVHCPLKEEMEITEFIKRFSDLDYFLRGREGIDERDEFYVDLFDGYRVINYCNYLLDDFPCRRHPIYICGNRGGNIEFKKMNSVKYPNFIELFFYDVLNGEYDTIESQCQIFHPYRKEYDSWFALILEGDELCKVEEYPQNTIFGIEVEPDKKCISILDKEQAIERFHTLYAKTAQ